MEDKSSFRDATAELLREAFEGVKDGSKSTWFVEKKEAILPSISQLSAEQASQRGPNGLASIGAHTRHIAFILHWGNACHGDVPPTGSWEDTWKQNEFSDQEWNDLRLEIDSRYRAYLNWFSQNSDWSHEVGVIAPIALLPHVAFHLGAIRQLIKILGE